ncbi:MAG: TetR/AcrR family transcriptional regulator [Spirochaetaceae bacterium]|nr:MAG: TetR/AcrR family transcriptional regulator [Spirochaetaceae bacterium]
MSPRADVTEQRTAQIIAAASEIVADNGLDALRMDEVAERTGLSKGTLYLYFRSKHDLSLAMLERVLQRELDTVEGISATAATAEHALREFVDAVIRDIQMITRLMPISYGFLSIAFRNRQVQRALKKYLRRYIDSLTPIIRSGIESGEFQEVDPEEAAIAVAAVVEGTMLLWIYDRSMIDPARHIRSGIEHLLGGLKQ